MSENNHERISGPAAVAFDPQSKHCLDERVVRLGEFPAACGGHADVWKGQFENIEVAVKVLRLWSNSGASIQRDKLLKRLWREYSAWSSLSHPNVIELLGFSYKFSPDWFVFPSLISPWMSNGTVDVYIEVMYLTDVDHLRLLVGIARGLAYLHTHEPPIIHGDLRAGNVLVSDRGDACLSDFGLSRVLSEIKQTPTSSDPAGSLRWMSPELFRGEGGVTAQSDVWAYGMTMLEVLTRERPYSTAKSDAYVFGQINDGHTPSRPAKSLMTDELWQMCSQCWCFQPEERPSMPELLVRLSTRLEPGDASSSYGRPKSLEPRDPATPWRHGPGAQGLAQQDNPQSLSISPSRGRPLLRPDAPATRSPSLRPISPVRRSVQAVERVDNLPPERNELNSPSTNKVADYNGSAAATSGGLQDLALLVGIPSLQNLVRQMFQCYEALVNVKVCVEDCKMLHRRCVALLFNLRDANTSPMRMDLTESIIHAVWMSICTWSTWSHAKSFLLRSKIVKRLWRLNRRVSDHVIWLSRTKNLAINAEMELPPLPDDTHPNRVYRRRSRSPRAGVRALSRSESPHRFVRRSRSHDPYESAHHYRFSYQTPETAHSRPMRLDLIAPLARLSRSRSRSRMGPFGLVPSQGIFSQDSEGCLDGHITRLGTHSSELGRYADVWQGTYGGRKVAIKSTRTFSRRGTGVQAHDICEKLWLKYTVASTISHPNVLPLLGFSWEVSPESFVFPSLITPWMSNGSLSSYLEKNTDADIYELVLGIARGLACLHKQEPPIIHGDIRAENVLISASGAPCLSNLRLSQIIKAEGVQTSADIVGSLRWMCPELIHYDAEPNSASDVWAYGMTILEIASRNVPYQDVKITAAVLNRIRDGVLPDRPTGSATLSDAMWDLCRKCWTVYAPHRPNMQDLLSEMDRMARS